MLQTIKKCHNNLRDSIGGGAYDLERAVSAMPDTRHKRNHRREAGTSSQSYLERSALKAPEPIRVPTLILHGELDRTFPVAQARELAARIRETGSPVELIVFPGVGHGIPREQRREPIERFLNRFVLRN